MTAINASSNNKDERTDSKKHFEWRIFVEIIDF